jgi:hypothetical protein
VALWHITRFEQPSTCGPGPCDAIGPQFPFGVPALILDLVGIAAFVGIVVLAFVWLIAYARRLDAHEAHAAGTP